MSWNDTDFWTPPGFTLPVRRLAQWEIDAEIGRRYWPVLHPPAGWSKAPRGSRRSGPRSARAAVRAVIWALALERARGILGVLRYRRG